MKGTVRSGRDGEAQDRDTAVQGAQEDAAVETELARVAKEEKALVTLQELQDSANGDKRIIR